MVLCELLTRAGVNFSAAHCNFQLRGSDSLDDERFCVQRCEEMGLDISVQRFDTKEYARENKLSIQVAARNLRYDWFKRVLENKGSDFLITAHHADDNLETFMIHLSRGSGLRGLTGIPEKNGNILRPLLPFSREEILSFATSNGIRWREDESNAESDYLRNRIRNQLIPVMKETLPNLLNSFQQTLSHLREAGSIADDRLEEVRASVTRTENDITRIDIGKIGSFGDQKAYLYGLLHPYGFRQWEDVARLLGAQPGKKIFSDTHRLLKDRDHLLLQSLDTIPARDQASLIHPGQKEAHLGTETLKIQEMSAAQEPDTLSVTCKGKHVSCLDKQKLTYPLLVRKWQKGDYFYPKGMKGRKKLSKFFKDEKLSVPEKENIWLLCSRNEIVWIIGVRMDERFRVNEDTKSILRVELTKK